MRKDRLVHLIGRTGRFDSFNSFELRFSHVHAFLLLCYASACPFYSTLFSLRFFRLIYLFAQKKEQDKRTPGTRERQKNVVCIGSSVCKSKLVLRGAKRGRGGESLRVFFFCRTMDPMCATRCCKNSCHIKTSWRIGHIWLWWRSERNYFYCVLVYDILHKSVMGGV